jgi:hypothetical protein
VTEQSLPEQSNCHQRVADALTAAAWLVVVALLVRGEPGREAERLEGAFWTGFGRAYFGLDRRK